MHHEVCKVSVLEDFTVSVLLTAQRSDCFDPTSQLSAYTLETDVRGTLKFSHVTMVSRYAANLFFTITNLGRICFNHLSNLIVSEIDGTKSTLITTAIRNLLLY